MFYIQKKIGSKYYIRDTEDDSVDICTISDIERFASLGIKINGVSIINGKPDVRVYEEGIIPADITKYDTPIQRSLRERLLNGVGKYKLIGVSCETIEKDDNRTDVFDYHVLENIETNERILVSSEPIVMLFVYKVLGVKFKAEICNTSFRNGIRAVDIPVLDIHSDILRSCVSSLSQSVNLPFDKPDNLNKQGVSVKLCRVKYSDDKIKDSVYFDTKSLKG